MSLRDKFSNIWARGNGSYPDESTDPPPSRFGHRRLLSSTDAHVPTVAVKAQESSLSPRKLHKAASTTFQTFSNTIRARAQTFYVNTAQAEAHEPTTHEPTTPKRSPGRSSLWSSVRSRKSRSVRDKRLKQELEHEIPLEEDSPSIGSAPKLELNLPSSTFAFYPTTDDVATPSMTPDDADNESPVSSSCGSSPPNVSMGPREMWDEPRARRNRRYEAVFEDASTDDDSDFGYELTAQRKRHTLPSSQWLRSGRALGKITGESSSSGSSDTTTSQAGSSVSLVPQPALERRAHYLALCQFIYKCEEEAQREEDEEFDTSSELEGLEGHYSKRKFRGYLPRRPGDV